MPGESLTWVKQKTFSDPGEGHIRDSQVGSDVVLGYAVDEVRVSFQKVAIAHPEGIEQKGLLPFLLEQGQSFGNTSAKAFPTDVAVKELPQPIVGQDDGVSQFYRLDKERARRLENEAVHGGREVSSGGKMFVELFAFFGEVVIPDQTLDDEIGVIHRISGPDQVAATLKGAFAPKHGGELPLRPGDIG